MNENVKVLDCTIRDGGYYNEWDFCRAYVDKYLAAVGAACIYVVEVGFRFFPQSKFLGAFAYSSDDYLRTLPLPNNVIIAVMVNAAELIQHPRGAVYAIHALFNTRDESPVGIVRVATNARDISACEEIANTLCKLGYSVFMNLMQVSVLEKEEITNISSEISGWGSVETLYFADTFGSMDSDDVVLTINSIAKVWDGAVGIHAHDNKGQALSNCMTALKCGVDYLDSTLNGMGRGAGNAKTENLLVELELREFKKYFPDAVFPLALKEFSSLQEKFQWGSNFYYFLSAVHGIHPSYIQEMLSDERYSTEQILSAINFLKMTKLPFYSSQNMLRALSGEEGCEFGNWSPVDRISGRTVLVLGSGPGTRRYIQELSQYVERHKPVVFCLNINDDVPQDIVDFYLSCHESRILFESDSYFDLKVPLIAPLSRLPKNILESLRDVEILDYGLRVQKESFEIQENGCVLDSPLVLSYALSVATSGNAAQILLAGMDGYEASDPRQQEIIDLFSRYSKLDKTCHILAVTPSTYPVEKTSLFNPEIY